MGFSTFECNIWRRGKKITNRNNGRSQNQVGKKEHKYKWMKKEVRRDHPAILIGVVKHRAAGRFAYCAPRLAWQSRLGGSYQPKDKLKELQKSERKTLPAKTTESSEKKKEKKIESRKKATEENGPLWKRRKASGKQMPTGGWNNVSGWLLAGGRHAGELALFSREPSSSTAMNVLTFCTPFFFDGGPHFSLHV